MIYPYARNVGRLWTSCAILLSISALFSTTHAESGITYRGVNLSIAEFGENHLPGNYGTDYIYPTNAELDYFIGKGMNTFRLPFRWERLQREQFVPFFNDELDRLRGFVNAATNRGATVILDPHNYSRYYGFVIGESTVPTAAFADFWSRLANEFKFNPLVIFGLMNEPRDMTTELWLQNANSAIAAIRDSGATNLILVPGNGYTGAHSWNQDYYGTPNGTVMLNVFDPLDNYAFEVHQYLDQNHSGTSALCVSSTIGSQRLADFTQWLENNDKQGFLGEFGGGSNQTCLNAIGDMLGYLHTHSDVWLGWTYWAAGPWWGDYFTSIEPENNGTDKPQMNALEPYLANINIVSSCLAGLGRVDLNIVNNQTTSSVYRFELQGQTARQTSVIFENWGRIPITGRPVCSYSVVVKRDGVIVLSENISINCDDPVPTVSTPEVTILNACRSNNGYVLFQMVNPSSTTCNYILEFEGVRNRSTSAAPFGQSVRATTGRPDGSYNYLVRTDSKVVDSGVVTVNCD